jgi:hypothetical protein
VVIQCDSALIAATPFQRHRRGRQKVERAVLPVELEDAVERQEAGQKRAEPEDAGRDGFEDLRLGAHAEGNERGEDQEEGEREAEAAARAHRQCEVAFQEAHHGATSSAKGSPPKGSSAQALGHERGHVEGAGVRQAEVDMGGDDGRAALCQVRLDRAGEAGDVVHVERDRRLVEAPERAARDQKARERQAAFLAGRHLARAAVARGCRSKASSAGAMSEAAKALAQKRRFSATVSCALSPSAWPA